MKQNSSGIFCWPLKRLFTKNFGSVVGGSLFTGFFYIPALIISFLASRVDLPGLIPMLTSILVATHTVRPLARHNTSVIDRGSADKINPY
jgi:hypothetical protein